MHCYSHIVQREKGQIAPGELLMATCPWYPCTPTIDAYTQGDNKLVIVNGDWVGHIHALFLYSLGGPSSGFVAMMVALAVARELGGTLEVYVSTPTVSVSPPSQPAPVHPPPISILCRLPTPQPSPPPPLTSLRSLHSTAPTEHCPGHRPQLAPNITTTAPQVWLRRLREMREVPRACIL